MRKSSLIALDILILFIVFLGIFEKYGFISSFVSSMILVIFMILFQEKHIRKKIMNFLKSQYSYEALRTFISFLFASFITIWVLFTKKTNDIKELFDMGVIFAIILAIFIDSFAKLVHKIVANKFEDSKKLTEDYTELAKRYYDDQVISFGNDVTDYVEQANVEVLCKELQPKMKQMQINAKTTYPMKTPVRFDYDLNQKKIYIHDENKMYQLPDKIKDNFDTLFMAHEASNTYNQLNVRVDDWVMKEDGFHIFTSRTTYFDSLVTNRAMDYRWKNGGSTRDFYDYGPFVTELSKSYLSNHLGFNGFIESSDNKIPFIKRNNNVSIGKNTYAVSIGASLKTKYALNGDKLFTYEGLENSMIREIQDELKIKRTDLEDIDLSKMLIAAYRDLVEGGKPQLLFYIKCKKSSKEIEENFYQEIKSKKQKDLSKKELKELEDGNKILWIDKDDIKKMAISSGFIVHKQKKYYMMPSAVASVILLRNQINKEV